MVDLEVCEAGNVSQSLRVGLCQLAARGNFAEDEGRKSGAEALAQQVGLQDGTDFVSPGKDDGAAGGEDDRDVLVDRCHGLDDGVHRLREVHGGVVEAFLDIHIGAGDEEQDLVGLLGDCFRFRDETLVHFVEHLEVVTRCIGEVHTEVFERGVGALDAVSVDVRGTAALNERVLGAGADDGDFIGLLEGKKVVVVLQKDRALLGKLDGVGVVGFLVPDSGFAEGTGSGLVHEVQDAAGARFDLFLGDLAVAISLCDLADGVVAGAGHFEVEAGLEGSHAVGRGHPVTDGQAFEAPFPTEDVLHEVAVFGAVLAVDLVVGHHDGPGLRLFDSDLKAAEIDFPECSLVDDGIRLVTEVFRAVACEVFDGRADAFGLDAVDVVRCQRTGQERVFRVVLEVSAAERRTFDADAGAQQDRQALCAAFVTENFAECSGAFLVPCAGHGGRGREADGGDGPKALHLPQAGGAVGDHDGRDS